MRIKFAGEIRVDFYRIMSKIEMIRYANHFFVLYLWVNFKKE